MCRKQMDPPFRTCSPRRNLKVLSSLSVCVPSDGVGGHLSTCLARCETRQHLPRPHTCATLRRSTHMPSSIVCTRPALCASSNMAWRMCKCEHVVQSHVSALFVRAYTPTQRWHVTLVLIKHLLISCLCINKKGIVPRITPPSLFPLPPSVSQSIPLAFLHFPSCQPPWNNIHTHSEFHRKGSTASHPSG